MEDLSIRDPKSNLIYNNFSHEYFMKVFRNDFDNAKQYRDEVYSKVNFNNAKYAVLADNIECIHSDAFIRNKDTKYFNTFKEAEKQYFNNCIDLNISNTTAVEKLSVLDGKDFFACNADISIFQK